MKLLILTQKVDRRDTTLGFFHKWIEEFAKHCETIIVVALCIGDYDLPKNVKILSLGKEKGVSRIKYIWNFYRYILREWKHYDVAFVHMNPEFVILGGPLWKFLNKKVSLWYTHRNVDLKLRVATFFADVIFSASAHGFRLKNKKTHFMSHGIDVEFWGNITQRDRDIFTIVQVGRITPIKHCEILIDAALILKTQLTHPFVIYFIGEQTTPVYFHNMENKVRDLNLGDHIFFLDGMLALALRDYLGNVDVVVNMLPTGGMDKVVLESLAAGIPVITSNHAFIELYGPHAKKFILPELHQGSAGDLAQALGQILREGVSNEIRKDLQNSVRAKANQAMLIENIVNILKQ